MKTRTSLAAALAAGLIAPALALTAPAHAAAIDVSHAQLRWGINNESNNKAYFGYNFFSAGKVGDPGAGSQQLNNADQGATWSNGSAAGWSARVGNATIEKLQADGSYAVTSWGQRNTDVDGVLDASEANDVYSGHQVVLDNGVGTLDPAADDADVSWDADFTVIYYSGFTFFYVSDPVLHVVDGVGTLTATLSGYGADMYDEGKWVSLPDTAVTLATLSDVEVSETGIDEAAVDYLGVSVDTGSGAAQSTTGALWGSFPQSFVDFQQQTGQSSYWYSSGSAIDKGKVALPLTVQADATPTPLPEGGDDDTTPPPAGGGDTTPPPAGSQTPPTTTPPASTTDPAAQVKAQLKAKLAKAKKALKKAKKAGNTAKAKKLKKRIKKLKKQLR